MHLFDKLQSYKIILASASPRRKDLLKGLDINFEVKKINFSEVVDQEVPAIDLAEALSQLKSSQVPQQYLTRNNLIITSDTLVIEDETMLGKPKDRDEAIKMLDSLSGKWHEVVTGVCFRHLDRIHSFHEITKVLFKTLSREEIEYYIDKYHPYDKAGAYGIQEWIGKIGIKEIRGSYWNVMGLPVQRLYEELNIFLK